MKKVIFIIYGLMLFMIFSINVNALTINKSDNIKWEDCDKSNSINIGDKVSVVYKNGVSDYNATQEFYVLKSEGKYTYLFSIYNLNVGTYKTNPDVNFGITAPSIRAWVGQDKENYGTVTQEEIKNSLDTWLNNYKNELQSGYNLNVESVDLLSRDDAINYLLLTSNHEGTAFNYNSDKYSNTSYWLKDMYDSSNKYYINGSNNTINKQSDGYSGIRTVLKVKTKYLTGISINYVKPKIITSEGDGVCLNINNTKQCFTFLKKGENNTNYYFAKYNLNVGYYYNPDKPTGIQDATIKAWVDDSKPNYGRVPYKTSNIYFQDYKDRLFNSGYNIISIDYLTANDAEDNYSLSHFVAEKKYSIATAFKDSTKASLYANTTYWLKNSYDGEFNYYINAANQIGIANDVSGLRPVIQLADSDITDIEKFNNGNVEYNENDSTINVSPDEGYELDKLYILNSNGEYLNYTKEKTNVYKFINEDNWNINISATFKAKYYKIIRGNKQTFNNNSMEFEVSAKDRMIDKIYINNELLDTKYYSVNNSKITLNKSYLSTLEKGQYTFKITYKNNTYNETTFEIKDSIIEENPDTADKVIYYIILASLSLFTTVSLIRARVFSGK